MGGLMLISHPDVGMNWTWVYGFQVWGSGEPRWCCVCSCLRFWGLVRVCSPRSGLFTVHESWTGAQFEQSGQLTGLRCCVNLGMEVSMGLKISCDADGCKETSTSAEIQQWSALFLPKGWKFIYGKEKVAKIYCHKHSTDTK
jgi:hypothetical protein